MAQTLDGGLAIAGYTESYGAGELDVFLVKVNSEGELEGEGVFSEAEFGLARTDTTANAITLHRGTKDIYWNYVRVLIWKID